jgi:hypothetical protein
VMTVAEASDASDTAVVGTWDRSDRHTCLDNCTGQLQASTARISRFAQVVTAPIVSRLGGMEPAQSEPAP